MLHKCSATLRGTGPHERQVQEEDKVHRWRLLHRSPKSKGQEQSAVSSSSRTPFLTLHSWAIGSFLLHPSSVLTLFEGRVQLGMVVEGASHGRRYCELTPLCRTSFSLSQRMGWEKNNSLAWPIPQSQVLHNLSLQLRPLLICFHAGPQPALWANPDLRQEGFKDLASTSFCYPGSWDTSGPDNCAFICSWNSVLVVYFSKLD